jgi:RNA polymerase sigma factor (sigma-70 family)
MTRRLATLTRRLLGLDHPPGGADTDRQLLERFIRDRDQTAFAALLERHGPMILAVCRRVLGRSADADDAFQATFLVLVRRATAVGWHDSLGGWLYTVAHRVACKARATRTANPVPQAGSQEVPTVTDADPPTAAAHRELRGVLDEELARLPEKYRLPLVMCYLEGWTNEEAALQLGWTKGTVSGRLARARDLLRGRLARRGLALSVAALEVALSAMASAGTPPAALFESTLAAAALSAPGSTVAGIVSARTVALSEGVSRVMFLTRLKMTAAALLACCLLGAGATLVALHARSADQKEVKPEPAPKLADKPAKPMTEENLEGTWMVTNAESFQRGHKWTFTGGQLEGYGEPNKEVNTWYKLDPAQKPKSIDLTVQSGTDGPVLFTVKGIYQLEGDELKICFASPGEVRPKAFPAEKALTSVLVFQRVLPAKVTSLDKRGGKPPMQFHDVTLELTNTRDRPVWLVTRYWGDRPLTGSGKFLEQSDGKPRMFSGDGFNGKRGGKGEAIRVAYVGNFRAFLLAPKATVRFDRYTIESWNDVEQFEVWEVSALRVNGRTALEKWLPYPTRTEGDVVIPAQTPPSELDWDPKTSQSRKDYPNERIEFVQADVIKKWLVPIAKRNAKDNKPANTP